MGVARELTPRGAYQVAFDVSPDGRTLVFGRRLAGAIDFFSLALPTGVPITPLLETPFDEGDLRLSPDGRYAAFTSNESGRSEVYLAPFPRLADKTRVSREGALLPRFSRDGRELFYVTADRRLVAVPLRNGAVLESGDPRTLFTLPGRYLWAGFDVAPDGKRFLAIVPEVVAREHPVTVVVNGCPATVETRIGGTIGDPQLEVGHAHSVGVHARVSLVELVSDTGCSPGEALDCSLDSRLGG